MINSLRVVLMFGLLMLLLAACTGLSGLGQRTTPVAVTGGEIGDFDELVEALRAAGAEVEPGEAVSQPFLSVEGRLLKVDGQDVQVFAYPSEEARAAEAELIPPDGSSFEIIMITWVAAPHFYQSGRVIALYVGDDIQVQALLSQALGEPFAGG